MTTGVSPITGTCKKIKGEFPYSSVFVLCAIIARWEANDGNQWGRTERARAGSGTVEQSRVSVVPERNYHD